MLFLSKIISLPLKTPKTGSFQRGLLSTMVEYRLAVQFARVQVSLKSVFIFQFRYLCCCYRKQMVCCEYKLASSKHFLSKIISLPPKTPKTGSFLRRLLQHNSRVQASCAIYWGSSLTQVRIYFFNQVFSLLLQETMRSTKSTNSCTCVAA